MDADLVSCELALTELGLEALDAIHVTAAVDLSPFDAFLSYDERHAAARLAGLRTVSPGACRPTTSRSEITRSPVGSSVSWCFGKRGSYLSVEPAEFVPDLWKERD